MNQSGTQQLDLMLPANSSLLHFGRHDADSNQLIFPIVFALPFEQPPLVMVALSGLVTDSSIGRPTSLGDVKLSLVAREITPAGFNILLTIRRGDGTASLDVAWIAITA